MPPPRTGVAAYEAVRSKETAMAHEADHADRAAHDPRSQEMVETEPPERLAHWAQALKVTPEALRAAVQAVGPRVDRIKDHLTGGAAGRQQDG
jgi:hypothetical protein